MAKIIFVVAKITYFLYSENLSSYSKNMGEVSIPCFVMANSKLVKAKMDLKPFLYFPFKYP